MPPTWFRAFQGIEFVDRGEIVFLENKGGDLGWF